MSLDKQILETLHGCLYCDLPILSQKLKLPEAKLVPALTRLIQQGLVEKQTINFPSHAPKTVLRDLYNRRSQMARYQLSGQGRKLINQEKYGWE